MQPNPDINQTQLKTAEQGIDVYNTNDYGDEYAQQDLNGQNNQPSYEGDADYMVNPNQQQTEETQEQNRLSQTTENMKMLHLFDLVQDLYEYEDILANNLKEIDLTRFDIKIIGKIKDVECRLEMLLKRTKDFIIEVFYKETYEKNLYIYMTLRQELLIMTKYIRELLKLNNLELKNERK